MKTFTFRYERSPRKTALAAMKRAIKTGNADVSGDEMICDSMDAMLKLMSKTRFDAFAAIVERRPKSLYDLSNLLDKDPANVLRDARALEALGLIKLKTAKAGERERLVPVPVYERIVMEFEPKKMAVGAE